MRYKYVPALIATALAVGACDSTPTNPVDVDARGGLSPSSPNFTGVMYGSGNRAGESTLQTDAAADSIQPPATAFGGVMYGSGN